MVNELTSRYSRFLVPGIFFISIVLTSFSFCYLLYHHGFSALGLAAHLLILGLALFVALKSVGFEFGRRKRDREWNFHLELERTFDLVSRIRALDMVEVKADLNDCRRYLMVSESKESFLANLPDLNKLLSCYSDKLAVFIGTLEDKKLDQSEKTHLLQYINKSLYPGMREVVKHFAEFRKTHQSDDLIKLHDHYIFGIHRAKLLKNSPDSSSWSEDIKKVYIEGVSQSDRKDFAIALNMFDVLLEWLQDAEKGRCFGAEYI